MEHVSADNATGFAMNNRGEQPVVSDGSIGAQKNAWMLGWNAMGTNFGHGTMNR